MKVVGTKIKLFDLLLECMGIVDVAKLIWQLIPASASPEEKSSTELFCFRNNAHSDVSMSSSSLTEIQMFVDIFWGTCNHDFPKHSYVHHFNKIIER